MTKLCYFIPLLLISLVNARPIVSKELPNPDNPDNLEWNQQQPQECQLPQEYRSPESEEVDNLVDERSPRLILDDYNNVDAAGFGQEIGEGEFQNEESAALDDREKRSNSDDSLVDADIKRYETILEETGKALERSALTEEERQSEDTDSVNREKREASSDAFEDEEIADESEESENVKEEGEDDSVSKADETVAENKESDEEEDDPAELQNDSSDDGEGELDDANAGASEGDASEDESAEGDAAEDDAAVNDEAIGDAETGDDNEVGATRDDGTEEDAAEDDTAEGDAAEDDAVEGDAAEGDPAEDDAVNDNAVEEKDSDSEDDSSESDVKESLNEVKSLDNFLEGLNEQTDKLSQLRDGLSSVLETDFNPKENSRTRRQAVKRIVHENTVDYLKALPQYKDVPRDVLNSVIQTLGQKGGEVKEPAVVEEIHESQPAERQAVRVAKADTPTMAPVPQAPATPCSSTSKGPQSKEEKELDKVIDMRKAEESIVSKEQDEVIKAEHMAHTMQEDLHDVMREIRALKVEINAERKDAEKVSIETKEAQKDLEMHDERKYNARRKVDELYMRLTDLESDTCDSRNKRKVLERFLDSEHYVLARRRRMLKGKQQHHHARPRAAGNGAVATGARQSGSVQQGHKADDLSQVILGQSPAVEPLPVARQAKPCEANDSESKKDQEYNSILQQIIIGEAQVKVEDVQVARAEEEAVSLHKRLSNVLSKLAALSIEMKNLQTQAQVSGKRAKEAQAELAYHDQILFVARKKVNAARNLESDLQRAISDSQMNAKSKCSSTCAPSNSQGG